MFRVLATSRQQAEQFMQKEKGRVRVLSLSADVFWA
jgi:hypothetical protein